MVLAEHLSGASVVTAFQRLQLVLIPVALGAFLLDDRRLRLGLGLFVVAAAALGLSFLSLQHVPALLQVQKNPAGQYVADGVLILLALPMRVWLRVVGLGTARRRALRDAEPRARSSALAWVCSSSVQPSRHQPV